MLMNKALKTSVLTASVLGLVIALSGTGGTGAQSASRCAPFPSFPDASCTGVLPGVARTNSGSITTSSAGQVIQNLNVSGKIVVNHDNVTIRNVKITNPGGVAITNISSQSRNLLIEDVELDGTGNSNGASAVDYYNYTLRRVHIHHYGEGPGCGDNVTMEDSYLHDFVAFSGAHQDGIQCEFGGNNLIRHNTIIMNFINTNNGNAAIVFGGNTEDNTAEYNLLAGAAFTLYQGQAGGTFRHNRFRVSPAAGFGQVYPSSAIGPWTPEAPCGNLWYDGPLAGQAVPGGGPVNCAGGTTLPPAPTAPTNVRVVR